MSLDSNAAKRKERLALLKKRKRPENDDGIGALVSAERSQELQKDAAEAESKMKFRNYDPETKMPKLGFLEPPVAKDSEETVEHRAKALAKEVAEEAKKSATAAQELDLFNLQPKKPNWDLKRDLEWRMEKLKTKQDAAVAKLVRERILAIQLKGNQDEIEAIQGGADLAREVDRREAEARRVALREV